MRRIFPLLVIAWFLAGILAPAAVADPYETDEQYDFDPNAALVTANEALIAQLPNLQSAPRAARSRNVEQVAFLPLPGFNGDVWAHKHHAYVGRWGTAARPGLCPGTGVTVIDIKDPASPQIVSHAAALTGSTAEDMVVLTLETPFFAGDVLVVGIQACRPGGPRGLAIVDVTTPESPQLLKFFSTAAPAPFGGGVHETYAFQRADGRAFALLAIPGSEANPFLGGQGDVRIVEITDPRNPVQLAHWGALSKLGLDPSRGQGSAGASRFAHSVWASADGSTAYVSYWDAGVIALDISDPSAPTFIGRAAEPDSVHFEGNIHSAFPARGGNLIVATEEDFNPRTFAIKVNGPSSIAGMKPAFGRGVPPAPPLTGNAVGDVVYVGRGCPVSPGIPVADPYLGDPAGKIALIDRGACSFKSKLLRAQAAGANGALVANFDNAVLGMNIAPSVDPAGVAPPSIAAAAIAREHADEIKAVLAGSGTVNVTLSSSFILKNTWGLTRIFDARDRSNPVLLSTFGTANALTPPDTVGFFSVHNPFVRGNTLFLASYSDGVRVVDFSQPQSPREIASFVPPATPDPFGFWAGGASITFVWGVYPLGDLLLLSDINAGLYILRLTADPQKP